jgi:hypothetical protein
MLGVGSMGGDDGVHSRKNKRAIHKSMSKSEKREQHMKKAARKAESGGGGGGDACCGAPDNQTQVALWKYLAMLLLFCGGAFQVVGPLWSNMGKLFNNNTTRIASDDAAAVRQVFQSGEPWVVWCVNGTLPTPVIAYDAADEAYKSQTPATAFKTGIMDCGLPLPSGKSVFDRFNLDAKNTHAFVVANGGKPSMLPLAYFQGAKASSKLIRFVRKRIQVRTHTITSTKFLRDKCANRKWCALVLRDGKKKKTYTAEAATVKRLSHAHRLISFVTVDRAEYETSIERKLPPPANGVPTWPRLVLLHRDSVAQEAAKKVLADDVFDDEMTDDERNQFAATGARPAAIVAKVAAAKKAAAEPTVLAKSFSGKINLTGDDDSAVSSFLTDTMRVEREEGDGSVMKSMKAPSMRRRKKVSTNGNMSKKARAARAKKEAEDDGKYCC